jgi:hypothetical protein
MLSSGISSPTTQGPLSPWHMRRDLVLERQLSRARHPLRRHKVDVERSVM